MGIFFSVDNYTINLTQEQNDTVYAFFEGLLWDDVSDSVVADNILFGDLMEMVDYNNRWIYKGSVTSPPCATYVYWNVLTTVYPVS